MSLEDFLLYFFSGFSWGIGLAGQYICFEKIAVSNTMPLYIALCTIGNSLVGGFIFFEWSGLEDDLVGLVGIIIILAGVFITNKHSKPANTNVKYYALLIITTVGWWLYSALPHYVQSSKGLPQAIGMVAVTIGIFFFENKKIPGNDNFGLRNMTSGANFAIVAGLYMVSLKKDGFVDGFVNAFVMSQMNVVISTLLGVLLLHEANLNLLKNKILGLSVLVAGSFLIVQI